MLTAVTLLATGVLGVVLYWLFRPAPGSSCPKYPQPGRWYWLKRAVFTIIFHRQKFRERNKASASDKRRDGSQNCKTVGQSLHPLDMECVLPLPNHPHGMDSVCIGAFSTKDGTSLSLRVSRCQNRRAEVWLILWVPGIGCLRHPAHPDTAVTNVNPFAFTAGGLTFQVVHPMKTWRVSFSGQLRLEPCISAGDQSDKLLDTKFSFQWDAFAPYFHYNSDLHPSLLAESAAREKWSKDIFNRLENRERQSHYIQWGELRGSLCVEEHPAQQLRLKAIRSHSFGLQKWTDFHKYVSCSLYIENGTTLQVGASSHPGTLSHLKTGCLTYPTGEVAAVTEVNFDLWEVGEDEQKQPARWTFSLVADGMRYDVTMTTKKRTLLYLEDDRGGIMHEAFCDATLNGLRGWGMSEFFYRNSERSAVKLGPTVPLLDDPDWQTVKGSSNELVLAFTSPACCSSVLVGGKGAQLAQLTCMSQMEDVSVPPGLCVTLRAFELQMQERENLQQAINLVAETAATDPLKLEASCKEASAVLCDTAVCDEVRKAVVAALRQVFSDLQSVRVAVRSSAAGEDGCEASSAGQMETFLGVRGETEILQALQKCWASAYTFQAVEYRRQHGQAVLTSVGVVIQQMVPAEAAGVLFTAEPLTNNVNMMLINANFGLGESVVSGKSDPDTFIIRRGWDDHLTITKRHIGQKQTKIAMQDDGGIAEVGISATDSQQACMKDEVILSLAKTGMRTEKYFGSPRDIEWAYAQGKIYLLQARPITTSELESEEELVHEFDSPLSGDEVWLTTGNIGEMMPGAVTPLTLSTFFASIEKSMQRWSKGLRARQQLVNYHKALVSCGNNLFISLTDVNLVVLAVVLCNKEALEMSLLGETRPDLRSQVVLNYLGRPPPGFLTRLWNSACMIRYLRKGFSKTKDWEKRVETFQLAQGSNTAHEVYAAIDQHIPDLNEVWHWTLVNSSSSGSWASILINIITKGSTDWKTEHYGDIALLLSQCQNVNSAEVPSAMQELADEIVAEGLKDKFQSSSNKDCADLLTNAEYPRLQQKMQNFLKHHGHRCIREAEMREKSWHLDPATLIGALKTILETGAHHKGKRSAKTPQQLVSEMKTPLSFVSRKILQYLLPTAWSAVASREWGKSISVRMNDIFKTTYWRLASLMVKEGRLPDEDILFFLTHYEIGVLLATRSARLVMKGQRRRKILSKQMALRFPKISTGVPQPLEVKQRTTVDSDDAGASVLTGMPVSQGVVQGPARIVLSLEDACTIQTGDILVVTSTDVGWSPYFPLIAGLVTEIGGLISHGAVVAREYGIPCVVNITEATSSIKNGTMVQLDGRAGTLRILS